MSSDLYVERPSFMHRLDPRTKILFLLGLFVLFLAEGSLPGLLLLLAFLVFLGAIAGALRLFRRFGILLLLVLLMAGLTKGLGAGIKMDGMILSGLLFLATTRQEEVLQGLVLFGLPFSVGFALTMAVRLVPVLTESAETVMLAQRSRGLELDRGSVLKRIRNHLPLLVPILVNALRGANQLAWALEARGFGYGVQRTSYLRLKWSRADFFIVALIFLLIIFGFLLKSH